MDVSSFHGKKGLGLNPLPRGNKVASISILRTRTRNHGFAKFNVVIDLEIRDLLSSML